LRTHFIDIAAGIFYSRCGEKVFLGVAIPYPTTARSHSAHIDERETKMNK